jgi:hypothetical protein
VELKLVYCYNRLNMLNKTQLKKISLTRFQEAEILYDKGKYEGMVHLCICSLEMALKNHIWSIYGAGFPQTTKEFSMLQEIRTHDLEKLFRLSKQAGTMSRNTKALASWYIVSALDIQVRYSPIGTVIPQDAKEIKEATNQLLKFFKIKR